MTATARSPAVSMRVHPRVCGETRCPLKLPGLTRGPSPRVRGNPSRWRGRCGKRGSIPACAGKPTRLRQPDSGDRVHPRVCGETPPSDDAHRSNLGPSPRVRGNPMQRVSGPSSCGSIPACAGKPRICSVVVSGMRVHPRVCGETQGKVSPRFRLTGPSPRVRGNRRRPLHHRPHAGSIPACAGKPRRPRGRIGAPRVHPRVCGETVPSSARTNSPRGPSPRVRGNLDCGFRARGADGSIPACAGKPPTRPDTSRRSWVHPRVCGETRLSWSGPASAAGPSPRVRGNLRHRLAARACVGSIPACAGKPR